MPSTVMLDHSHSLPFSSRSPFPTPVIADEKSSAQKKTQLNGIAPAQAVLSDASVTTAVAPPSSSPSPAPRDEDAESTFSYAASTHSIIDDVPRTPKRPMSVFDPRNPSVFTEALYVSIGLGVIAMGAFVGYKFISNRR